MSEWWHDTWQWWLHYGLDGIGGGIVGGIVGAGGAWLLLRSTIKHERRMAREVELRARVGELLAHVFESGFKLADLGPVGRERWAEQMRTETAIVAAHALGPAPRLASLLYEAASWFSDTDLREASVGTVENAAAQVGINLQHWMATPEDYEAQKSAVKWEIPAASAPQA